MSSVREIADAAWTNMPKSTLCINQRIRIAVALSIQSNTTQQGVIHRLLVKVGILCVVICEIQLVLEENKSTARTRLTISFIAKRVVRPKPSEVSPLPIPPVR